MHALLKSSTYKLVLYSLYTTLLKNSFIHVVSRIYMAFESAPFPLCLKIKLCVIGTQFTFNFLLVARVYIKLRRHSY